MKVSLVILCFIFSISAYSQKENLEIKGIGEFKLLETTSGFIDSLIANGKTFIKVNDDRFPFEEEKKYDIVEYLPNPIPDNSPFIVSFIKEARVFKLNKYKILDRYTTFDVTLIFYNDQLIYIKVKEPLSNLISDLHEKYGKPKQTILTSESPRCSEKKEQIINSEWLFDGDNKMAYDFGIKYFLDCSSYKENTLSAINIPKFGEYLTKENAEEKRIRSSYKSKVLSDL